MNKVLVYEGVGFNREWVKGKSFKEFSEHESHHGLSKEQLKEVHELCKAEAKKEETTPAAEVQS